MILRCQPIYTADAYGRNGCRFTVLADGRLTIDGVTGEVDIGVNEFASRRGQRYWRARPGGQKRGMAFNEVCVATVAEDVA